MVPGLLHIAIIIALSVTHASSHQAHQPKHLLVFEEGTYSHLSESEIAQLCLRAGGRLLTWHSAIGTALVVSQSPGFSNDVVAMDSRLRSAAAAEDMPIGRTARIPEHNMRKVEAPNYDDTSSQRSMSINYHWGDSLSNKQWDMVQMGVDRAQTITKGRSDVVVGVIDTGVDYDHPDLKPILDFSRSLSCIGGVKNYSRSAWKDKDGHGTHTASTVAAALNGRGIVGVAPGARVAAIHTSTPDGFFYAAAMVCAIMHIADSGMSVASASLYVDPWYFTCKNKSPQSAIYTAVNRAVQYAVGKKVAVVAAVGNEQINLDDPKFDDMSPNNATAYVRPVDQNCLILPAELDNVIAVSAVGNTTKACSYSNYGLKAVTVTAPGGDQAYPTKFAPRGLILGAYPSYLVSSYEGLLDQNGALYQYQEGTSMAVPHVSGLIALMMSRYPPNDRPSAQEVKRILQSTARPMACPSPRGVCRVDSRNHTNLFGAGQVDAYAAVMASGNANNTQSAQPQKPKTPSPIKPEPPSPITAKTPIPIKAKTPIPITAKTPIPIKAKTPSPIKAKTPIPIKAKTPIPIKAKTPSPIKTKAPTAPSMPTG